MKICVWRFEAEVFSMLRIASRRWSAFAGRYPQKANDCPLRPDAISASIIDEGPVSGTTWMPLRWHSATKGAPGSATAGNPASVIGMFETQQEQELAAAMFNKRLNGLTDTREQEKALKDIVISIRKAAAERERKQFEDAMQEPSAEMLGRMLSTKKELQARSKIRFTLRSVSAQE